MLRQRFATAITCRESSEDPAIAWIKRNYHVDTVDIIASPGSIGKLATEPEGKTTKTILQKIEQSRQTHGSNLVAIVAHEDCKRDAATKETQYHYLNTASDLIYTSGYPGDIIRLWVDTHNTVHQLP
jgi:hypothetical protein